ncbi:MAG: C-type cytochrome biogenesis protein ResA (thioredoxin), partial [uncultured Ramlibacter sp.]
EEGPLWHRRRRRRRWGGIAGARHGNQPGARGHLRAAGRLEEDHVRLQGPRDAGEFLGHQLRHLRGRDAEDRGDPRQVQGQGLRHARRGHELRPAELRGELRADAQAAFPRRDRQHWRRGQGLGRRAADPDHLHRQQARRDREALCGRAELRRTAPADREAAGGIL